MPNFLRLVKNIYKKLDDGKPHHRVYITLQEPLPAGEYYAGVYLNQCKTRDGVYLGGAIVPHEAQPKKPIPHFQEKND